MDIITKKKNKDKSKGEVNASENNKDILEVAGVESSIKPLLECGDDDIDGSNIDALYKAKHKPIEGQLAQKWDLDF